MAAQKSKGWVVVHEEECKGCGLCIAVCTAECLEFADRLNHQGYHPVRHARRGIAGCHVILYKEAVDSPPVTRTSVRFAFNRPSLERPAQDVLGGGLVVYDSSPVPEPPPMPGIVSIGAPATSRETP